MPVKRRKSKARPWTITPEVVELFERCTDLAPIRSACIRSERACRSPDQGRHCSECAEYIEKSRQLDRLLNLPPWSASPLDTDLEGPAPYNKTGCWAESRPAALEIRREILKALK
jgi:hypothetical protein